MGCDIHLYLEYQEGVTHEGQPIWSTFVSNGGRRDYTMFGLLAGVRSGDDPIYPPKGVPEGKLAWQTENDLYLFVTDDPGRGELEGWCTTSQAKSWGNPIIPHGGSSHCKTRGPDWHSFSWLTREEYQTVLAKYMFDPAHGYQYSPEWDAILAAMLMFEERGCQTRIVFWFDN